MQLLLGSRGPRCLACLRRAIGSEHSLLFSPIQIQSRGKKKLPKSETITIRLIKDVKAYGRRGTILAVAPAFMRNKLYPQAQAAYMTAPEIKRAKAEDLVVERNLSFGNVKVAVEAKKEQEIIYDMKMITPQRARDIVEEIIPETIQFERKPIVEDAAASGDKSKLIFGSVSSLDILTDIISQLGRKATEAGFEDAAKVVMSAHDIQINTDDTSADLVEAEKIKALGDFEITISIKSTEPIKRKVTVVPLEVEL